MKSVKKKSNKGRKWLFFSITALSTLLVVGIIFGQFFMSSTLPQHKFYNNSFINNIDVSGKTVDEASDIVSTQLISSREEISIELNYQDKNWKYNGKEFEVNNKVLPLVQNAYSYGRVGNFWERQAAVKQIKNQGLNINISYKNVLGGLDERLNKVIAEIESEPVEPEVTLNSDTNRFVVSSEKNGVKVDREKLYSLIDEKFINEKEISIEVPTIEIPTQKTKEDIEANLILRGSFSTSYASSKLGRKTNVKRALKDFNGMKIEPDQQVSFNDVTGDKTKEKGYLPSNIILNGVYVEGIGGGVCQSATTLYNALILADIQIDEVNKHSLPVSYVLLAFDAMVSEGYSDLVFTNTTGEPIYIKAWGDDEKCYVKIYGKPREEGLEIKRRADFVRAIPHPGDTIVSDENGEYSNKVTYIGEYLRLKKPQEGYESNAYIDYYKNGNLVESKQIRHEVYQPQYGIIIEGTEVLGEGLTLPENTVKFIPPQTNTSTTKDNVEQKISNDRPNETAP